MAEGKALKQVRSMELGGRDGGLPCPGMTEPWEQLKLRALLSGNGGPWQAAASRDSVASPRDSGRSGCGELWGVFIMG